jgi:hypothetical protein
MLALALATIPLAPATSRVLPPQYLPVYGGAGGNAFTRSCGEGKVLTGLRFRARSVIDAVGILCRSVHTDGTLGPESTSGTLVGGSGGLSGSMSCLPGKVAIGTQIQHGMYVDRVILNCRNWNPTSRSFAASGGTLTEGAGGSSSTKRDVSCEALTQPFNGIRGRANWVVDAIGFICDEP